MAAILPCPSVMFASYSASAMDTWGGGFWRLLFQLRGQVRLGGIVEACRSTLGWLVRMVEGLVKQGTDGWDIVRI